MSGFSGRAVDRQRPRLRLGDRARARNGVTSSNTPVYGGGQRDSKGGGTREGLGQK